MMLRQTQTRRPDEKRSNKPSMRVTDQTKGQTSATRWTSRALPMAQLREPDDSTSDALARHVPVVMHTALAGRRADPPTGSSSDGAAALNGRGAAEWSS